MENFDKPVGRNDERMFNSRDITSEVSDRSVIDKYSTIVENYSDEQHARLLGVIAECVKQAANSDIEHRVDQLRQYREVVAEVVATLEDKIEALSQNTLAQQKIAEQAKLEYVTKMLDLDFDEVDDGRMSVGLEECRQVRSAAMATIMQNDTERVVYQAYKIGYDSYDRQLAVIESHLQEIMTHIGAIALHQQALSDLGDVQVVPVPPTMKKPTYETMDFSAVDEDLGFRPKDDVAHTYVTLPEVPITTIQSEKAPETAPTIDLSSLPLPRLVVRMNSPIGKLLNQGKVML